MCPATAHDTLQITSTEIFAAAPLNGSCSAIPAEKTQTNRALLQKFIPEISGRELTYSLYQYVTI